MTADRPEGAAVAPALAELTGLGPFFAVAAHAPGAVPASPWRSLSELVDDPDVLRDRVARVRGHLAAGNGRDPADIPLRVAASVAQLGATARLVSPVLGYALLTGGALDLSGAWWQPELGGAFPLSVPDRDAGSIAATLDGPVRGLIDAARPFSVSGRVLWGNVASAVNGAATMIVQARPDLAIPVAELAARVLAHPPLPATYDRSAGVFRRRSCCLIYRAAPPEAPRQLCGDCVLAARGR